MMHTRTAIALAVVLLPFAAAPARADGMKYPDYNSQWRSPTAGGHGDPNEPQGNPWDPTKPMGLRQLAPLTPEYQAIFEASVKALKAGSQGYSKGSTCLLPGMPKVMNFSEPMEIIVRPAITYILPLRYPTRRIYTDGRTFPTGDPPTRGGTSIGKWIDEDGDGTYDVLEVETRNFTGPRVFESSGIPLHSDNQTIVKERFYLDKHDKDMLHDEITTIDDALTRPWTVDRIVVREAEPYWTENSCHESNLHVRIGNEEYMLSADNKLMPVRADQPPPDLSHFGQAQK